MNGNDKKKKEVMLLFSGGKDSFLSGCYLIEKGFKVYMVTFENDAGLGASNAEHGAKRIIDRYGEERAVFLGVKNIAGIWREFLLPYFNMKPREVLNEFGELTVSQIHCLTCRSAMYTWVVIRAKQMGISYIADGARKDQKFVIELPSMIEKFKEFFKEYSIEMLLPVYDMSSDWQEKNLLLMRGFIPKVWEPQCLIGVPLPKVQDEEVQMAVCNYFEKIVLPRAKEIIVGQSNVILDEGKIL